MDYFVGLMKSGASLFSPLSRGETERAPSRSLGSGSKKRLHSNRWLGYDEVRRFSMSINSYTVYYKSNRARLLVEL